MSLLKVVRGLSERGENGKSLVGGCVCDGMERWKTRGRNTLAPTYLSTTLDVGEVVMVAIVDCCVECLEDCLEVAIRVLTYTPVYQVTYSRITIETWRMYCVATFSCGFRILSVSQPGMPSKATRIHARIDTKPWRRVKHGFARAFLNLFDPWQVGGRSEWLR